MSVVTLDLLARLHPDAEPERQVWWVHEPGPDAPVPTLCLLPFADLIGPMTRVIGRGLEAQRTEEGRTARQPEGVGLLDAADVAWLAGHATLRISTDSGLLSITGILDRLIERQPGLIEVAENWRSWLAQVSPGWTIGSTFELDLGPLFAPGAVFERTLSLRVFDPARFLATCEGAAAAERLRDELALVLAGVAVVETDGDPEVRRLQTLRQSVTYNRLEEFLSLADLSREADSRLLGPAFTAARAGRPAEADALTWQQAEVAATSGLASLRLQSLEAALDLVRRIRADDPATAATRYRHLLELYAADFQEENEFVGPWAQIVSNLSFLLIEKLEQPQQALDLLLPAVTSLDSRPAGSVRAEPETDTALARLRANLDAAVVRLRAQGVTTPPGVGVALSTADRAALSAADDDFTAALAVPDPARARQICEWALALLAERGVGPDKRTHVEWLTDWARAVRDAGELEQAAVTLRELVARCLTAPNMSLRTATGRAVVALGLTYRRMGRTADEIACYAEFLGSRQAQETSRTNTDQLSRVHHQYAEATGGQGDHSAAATHYLAAAGLADRLGQPERRKDNLTAALEAARLGQDAALEREASGLLGEAVPEPTTKNTGWRRLAEGGLLGWLRDR